MKLFGDEVNNDEAKDIAVTSDSQYIFVLGYTSYSARGGNNDIYLMKFRSDGTFVE